MRRQVVAPTFVYQNTKNGNKHGKNKTQKQNAKTKTLPPVDGRVLLKYNLLGVRRANCFAIHATAEVTAGWASHVRQRWRTAVRAGNSLHGRSLPIGATRMSISARGLVLWQCHNLSSISFNRLSLSVLYITASAIHYVKTNYIISANQPRFCEFSSFSLRPSSAAKRISVTS